MGQSRPLAPSILSATGTLVIATPRMTSCSLSWPSQPTSATKSSPSPSPPATSGQAPSVCFQVWTGAMTTVVSAPLTASQSHQLALKRTTHVCRDEERGEEIGRIGGRERLQEQFGKKRPSTPEVQSSSFARMSDAPLPL